MTTRVDFVAVELTSQAISILYELDRLNAISAHRVQTLYGTYVSDNKHFMPSQTMPQQYVHIITIKTSTTSTKDDEEVNNRRS